LFADAGTDIHFYFSVGVLCVFSWFLLYYNSFYHTAFIFPPIRKPQISLENALSDIVGSVRGNGGFDVLEQAQGNVAYGNSD
jgi:hypothetical protein